jgi:hypothetical protein
MYYFWFPKYKCQRCYNFEPWMRWLSKRHLYSEIERQRRRYVRTTCQFQATGYDQPTLLELNHSYGGRRVSE